jgi:hypothetical protein
VAEKDLSYLFTNQIPELHYKMLHVTEDRFYCIHNINYLTKLSYIRCFILDSLSVSGFDLAALRIAIRSLSSCDRDSFSRGNPMSTLK